MGEKTMQQEARFQEGWSLWTHRNKPLCETAQCRKLLDWVFEESYLKLVDARHSGEKPLPWKVGARLGRGLGLGWAIGRVGRYMADLGEITRSCRSP